MWDRVAFHVSASWDADVDRAWRSAGEPHVIWHGTSDDGLGWVAGTDIWSLAVDGPVSLVALQGAERLTRLIVLRPEADSQPVDWSQLPGLRAFDGSNPRGSGFDRLHLEDLSLWDFEGRDLAGLPFGPALRSCRLSPARRLRSLEGVEAATGLTELTLGYAPTTDYSPLSRLPQLAELTLAACPGVTDLSWIAQLTTMQRLTLENCKNVSGFLPIAEHRTLGTVALTGSTRPGDRDYRCLLGAHASRVYVETLPTWANVRRSELAARFPG